MRYIGLDLSMRATGVVVLDDEGSVIKRMRIGWKDSCATVHQRIAYFDKVSLAVSSLVADIAVEDDCLHEIAIAVEDYATHGPGDPTIGPELGAIVRLRLVKHPRLHEISATSLKKFACGKGNATKDVIMLEVYKRWGFDCNGDNNLADAYVLARMVRAAYLLDNTLTAAQREALDKAGLGKN